MKNRFRPGKLAQGQMKDLYFQMVEVFPAIFLSSGAGPGSGFDYFPMAGVQCPAVHLLLDVCHGTLTLLVSLRGCHSEHLKTYG